MIPILEEIANCSNIYSILCEPSNLPLLKKSQNTASLTNIPMSNYTLQQVNNNNNNYNRYKGLVSPSLGTISEDELLVQQAADKANSNIICYSDNDSFTMAMHNAQLIKSMAQINSNNNNNKSFANNNNANKRLNSNNDEDLYEMSRAQSHAQLRRTMAPISSNNNNKKIIASNNNNDYTTKESNSTVLEIKNPNNKQFMFSNNDIETRTISYFTIHN